MTWIKLSIIMIVLLTVAALLAIPTVREWRKRRITEENYRQAVLGLSRADVVELLGPPTSEEMQVGGGSTLEWRRSETRRCCVIRIRLDEAGRVVNHTFAVDGSQRRLRWPQRVQVAHHISAHFTPFSLVPQGLRASNSLSP